MSTTDALSEAKSDFENAILILSSPDFKEKLANYEDEVIYRFRQLIDLAITAPQDGVILNYDFTIALDNLMAIAVQPAENEAIKIFVQKILEELSQDKDLIVKVSKPFSFAEHLETLGMKEQADEFRETYMDTMRVMSGDEEREVSLFHNLDPGEWTLQSMHDFTDSNEGAGKWVFFGVYGFELLNDPTLILKNPNPVKTFQTWIVQGYSYDPHYHGLLGEAIKAIVSNPEYLAALGESLDEIRMTRMVLGAAYYGITDIENDPTLQSLNELISARRQVAKEVLPAVLNDFGIALPTVTPQSS